MTRQARSTLLTMTWFALATLVVLAIRGIEAPLHLDTARDLAIARDCVESPHCAGAGPTTSFGGGGFGADLLHGALWSHFLETRIRLHASFATLERAVAVMLAIAAALFAFTIRRAYGQRPTWIAWALWLTATLYAIEHPTLWNPTPAGLTLVVFHLALALGARDGSDSAFVVAAAALALSVDSHVAHAIIVPVFAAAIFACARRPALTATACGFTFAMVLSFDSPGSYAHNVEQLRPWRPHLALLVGVALAIGHHLREPMRRVRSSLRPLWVGGAAAAYMLVAIAALSVVGRHVVEARYVATAVVPLAILGAMALQRLFAAPLVAAVALLVVVVGNRPRRTSDAFTIRDVEKVAPELYARAAFSELFTRLRGPQAFPLLGMVAPFEAADARPKQLPNDLLVFKTRKDADLGGTRIPLGSGAFAVIVPIDSHIDMTAISACLEETHSCIGMRPDYGDRSGLSNRGWTSRAYPSLGAMHRAFRAARGTYSYRMRLTPANEPYVIAVGTAICRGWQIVAAPTDDPLPATHARIAPQRGGELWVRMSGCENEEWLPAVMQLPDDPRWLPLVGVTP